MKVPKTGCCASRHCSQSCRVAESQSRGQDLSPTRSSARRGPWPDVDLVFILVCCCCCVVVVMVVVVVVVDVVVEVDKVVKVVKAVEAVEV